MSCSHVVARIMKIILSPLCLYTGPNLHDLSSSSQSPQVSSFFFLLQNFIVPEAQWACLPRFESFITRKMKPSALLEYIVVVYSNIILTSV